MQPTMLAVLGSARELVRLGRGLTLLAPGRQGALEGIENPGDMVDELRAGQGTGRADVGVSRYRAVPAGQNLVAPLPQMSGDTREFAERGGCHGRTPTLRNCEEL